MLYLLQLLRAIKLYLSQADWGFLIRSLLISLIPVVIHASELPIGPLTTQDIENEQKQRLEQLEQNNQSLQELVPTPTLPESKPIESSQCIEIKAIIFEGNTIYDSNTLTEVSGFQSGCIGLNTINEYLRNISNHYMQAGYVTSRAFMTPQDLSGGVLQLVILEGKVEKVLFNGQESGALDMALPDSSGKVLNLRDIEQGLDQVNRLSRYNAQIKLLPSALQGYSIVDIQSAPHKFGSVGAGFNNSGQKSTGEQQISLSVTTDNLFKLLDQWSLTATKSAAYIDSKDSESLYLGVDIPYGYWNVGFRTSYSTYHTTFTNQGFTFDSSGQTNSHDLDIKWLLFRDSISKSSLRASVKHRREKNYILGSLVEASSRNLSATALSWEHSTRLAGGFLSAAPKIAIGTDWFGGEETLSNDPALPDAEFVKGSLTASYTYPIAPSVTMTSTLFGQWSNDTLYGAERISIGGEYSVRGFKGTSLSGDEGYYWRNDLTYRIGQWPYIGQITTVLALDTGTIVEDNRDQYEGGSLLGTSWSLNSQTKYASSSLAIGLPIEAPSQLNADDYVVHYRVNVTW